MNKIEYSTKKADTIIPKAGQWWKHIESGELYFLADIGGTFALICVDDECRGSQMWADEFVDDITKVFGLSSQNAFELITDPFTVIPGK